MSIYGDKCPACDECKKKCKSPNCVNRRTCPEYREWFRAAWNEIRIAAMRIKFERDRRNDEGK